MEFSQDRNKQILKEDVELIQNYVDSSDRKFTKTSHGFWISNSGQTSPTMAKTGDIIKYEFAVSDFNDQVVYTKNDHGLQDVMLGKSDIPRGLQMGLQMIEKGDSATFLFPSFLAFGGFGDQNKIKGNEPLIFNVYIKDIVKKKK